MAILPDHYQKRVSDIALKLNEAQAARHKADQEIAGCMGSLSSLIFEISVPTPAEVRTQRETGSKDFPEGHEGLITTIQYALPDVDGETYYKKAVHIAEKIREWQNDPSRIPGTVLRRGT